jgi:MoaA/NifB/PqqE/SkfB family radical SAM enzyme
METINYSELRQRPRLDLAASIPLAGPLSVYIEPTNICNFKCKFCPESFSNYKEESGGLFSLSESEHALIVDQLKQFGTVKTVNYYMMGEPLVNKSVFKMIKSLKAAKVSQKVILTTNGSLLTPKTYPQICESKLDYLRVSIYGSNEAEHRQNTQSKIPLERILNNVKGFKHYRDSNKTTKPFIYLKTIDAQDAQLNRDFLEFFDGAGDEVAIEPIMNWNDPSEGHLANLPHKELLNTSYFKQKKEVCPFPFYTLVINSDLSVSVCCVDWNKKVVVGNAKLNTLEEIWNGPAINEIRSKHLQRKKSSIPGCSTCTYLHTAPDNIDCMTASDCSKLG